jgi:Carboxypeptidase regulatory-like domain/TonB dependent receptor
MRRRKSWTHRQSSGWSWVCAEALGQPIGMRSLLFYGSAGRSAVARAERRTAGLITDPAGLSVPGARVVVQSEDTTATRTVSSNQQGEYSVPALLPGPYNITVEANGFKTIHQNGVVVEVDQRARLDFALIVGGNTETITVQGSAPLLNTSDASVSTLIGNRFVENLPLNGRSFSSLIDLTPGVVLTPSNTFEQGQFSVNGQRPDANYFLVDGVSANLGNAGSGALLGQGGAGQLPATSAFGGTSNLVSLDALEEFRIQTSTFAPEYGRTPGAQISVVTKSGTNTFHGTAFEYFRNDKLDANDWFANVNGLARPELRQNDFGGVLGGPIKKDTLFFFGSYEALRVRQPQVADTFVPSLASRQNATAAVQPLLNTFPLPNGPDLGKGTAAFSASYSDPSTLNSSGIRIDYLPLQRVTIFGRYSDAPSSLDQRAGSYIYSNISTLQYRTQSLTLGSSQAIISRWTNELRFNYSRSRANNFRTLDNSGGAKPPADSELYPSFASPQNSTFFFNAGSGLLSSKGKAGDNLEQQINLTDNLSYVIGAHQLKFGLDYRRLNSKAGPVPYQLQYVFNSLSNVLVNTVPNASVLSRTADVQLVFSSWSLFTQDSWKATRTLTITYGLRWEYNAAPSSPNGTLPFTVTQVNNLVTMSLAPPGTPLWRPQKDDFAPRLGVAWQPLPSLVLRGGAGIFYDLGYSGVANGETAFPYVQTKTIPTTSFPLSAGQAAPAPFTTAPPAGFMAVVDPNHVLPRTYQWNVALERALGKADVLTVTYLGAAGRKLMRRDLYNAPNPNFTGMFNVLWNGSDSSYEALQAQFRHRLAHGLQTLFSYTWAHAIDDASSDAYPINLPANYAPLSQERGSSDYDIRHTFSGAVSYNIPAPASGKWKTILGSWYRFDRLRSQRVPGECGHRTERLPSRSTRDRSCRRTAAESGSRSTALDCKSGRSRRNGNQSSRIHDTQYGDARRSGTQRPARIRHHAGRFDAAEAVQTPGAAFSSGASGSFQHLQPPQFWKPHKLSQFSSIRAIDSNAGSLSGKRRPEWRPQSAVSNRRPAIGATGS